MFYDCIVIGGGVAGLASALCGAQYGLSVLLLESQFTGGKVADVSVINNYLGFENGIEGDELTIKMENQVKAAKARILHEEVIEVNLKGETKEIMTNKGQYTCKAVVLATGSKRRELGVEGEKALVGTGISYSAKEDAEKYYGGTVGVAGGGDTACEYALSLTNYCEKVYLMYNERNLGAKKVLREEVQAENKIIPIKESVVAQLHSGIDMLEAVTVLSFDGMKLEKIKMHALFVAIGNEPNSEIFSKEVNISDGYIVTDENLKTNVEGVFAAGDVRTKGSRQMVRAMADGVVAMQSAIKYLEGEA